MNFDTFIPFFKNLAERSAEVIRPYFFDSGLAVETKADASPVTRADHETEQILRLLIGQKYPEHGIIGEEYGNKNEQADFVWVLDPIDGTVSFSTGVPLFGTLVALLYQGEPVLGMINQPVVNLCCIGNNESTWINDKKVRFRRIDSLEQATLLTTDIKNIERHQSLDNFNRLIDRTKTFRTWGDCYGYLLLAGGWADIMIDPVMNPWDLLPVIPIIKGAGGIISDWNGHDARQGQSAVAAGKQLHAGVIEILNADD